MFSLRQIYPPFSLDFPKKQGKIYARVSPYYCNFGPALDLAGPRGQGHQRQGRQTWFQEEVWGEGAVRLSWQRSLCRQPMDLIPAQPFPPCVTWTRPLSFCTCLPFKKREDDCRRGCFYHGYLLSASQVPLSVTFPFPAGEDLAKGENWGVSRCEWEGTRFCGSGQCWCFNVLRAPSLSTQVGDSHLWHPELVAAQADRVDEAGTERDLGHPPRSPGLQRGGHNPFVICLCLS